MMLKSPQDPASKSPTGYLDEPVSKQVYKNGVLEWRKQTWQVISGHTCKDSQVVFYTGKKAAAFDLHSYPCLAVMAHFGERQIFFCFA
jgi:hypothetical protein